MAKKAESFKVNAEEKTIIIYDNVKQTTAEKTLVEFYLTQGFTPLFEKKKKGITVAEMRKDLKGTDTLVEFERLYKSKKDGEGFHSACKLYNAWKKENKNK